MLILTPWAVTLNDALLKAKRSAYIVCPFIKTPIAAQIVGALDRRGVTVRTITRFKSDDFAAGVTDLDAAWMLSPHTEARSASFDLRTDDRLHAKIYLIDGEFAYVGSSNLTFSGLMRNYEACLHTEDPKVISQIQNELDTYWAKSRPRSVSDFSNMVSTLQRKGRRRPSEEDHIYDVSAPIDLYQKPEDEADLSWLQITKVISPIERITSAKAIEAEPDSAKHTSIEQSEQREALTHSDTLEPQVETDKVSRGVKSLAGLVPIFIARIEEFFQALEKMGVSARRHPLDYAVVLRHPSLRIFASTPTDATLASGIRLADLLKAPFEPEDTARSICEIAYWQIAARAGLVARFGRAGSSLLTNASRKQRILATQWHENFLGALVSQDSSPGDYQGAAHRLIQTIARREGLAAAIDFIETYFNPLDALGADLGSLFALKDAKTTLHEIAHAHSLRMIYSDAKNIGSEHETLWQCRVTLGTKIEANGSGPRKSAAEEDAAEQALIQVRKLPTYSKTYADIVAMGLTQARVKAFLLPRHVLTENEIERVQNAYKSVYGIRLDPQLGYSALLDSKTANARQLPGNHQALGPLGRSLIIYGIWRCLWSKRGTLQRPTLSKEFWDELPLVFDIPRLRDAAGFLREIEREPMQTTLEAVLAAACLDLGWEAGLDALANNFETAGRRVEELSHTLAASADFTVDNLRALTRDFDPAASYVHILQSFTQKLDQTLPNYEYVQVGPLQKPTFTALARWRDTIGKGTGSTKVSASHRAAHALLHNLRDQLNSLVEEMAMNEAKRAATRLARKRSRNDGHNQEHS